MHLDFGGQWPYVGVLLAAAIEGEVAYVLAATLVGQGQLNPFGVLVAGAVGAAAGDQFFFYVLRGRLRRWLDRFEKLAASGRAFIARVERHQVPMVFAIRFAPGLRIALAAACAYAGVKPILFSLVSLASSFVWGIALLLLVGYAGPAFLPSLGISGWWSGLIPAALIVILFRWLGRAERRAMPDAHSLK